jgi:hypothetical protein
VRRCEETVLRGIPAGPAVCDHPLDAYGQCSEASDHVEDYYIDERGVVVPR